MDENIFGAYKGNLNYDEEIKNQSEGKIYLI